MDSWSLFFIDLCNRSINAGWLILAVILFRSIFRRAPKQVICCLWGLVGFRLICPFSIESIYSLIPSRATIPSDIAILQEPEIESGIGVIDDVLNPVIEETLTPNLGDSTNPLQIVISIVAALWCIGLAIILIHAVVSYRKLKRKTASSVSLGGRIAACDGIDVPFILGIIDPRICIPYGVDSRSLDIAVQHERAHLKRLDHLWKPLGFLILSIHWLNPLCWLAYVLFCTDIEMACDECVIRNMNKDDIAAYSQAILDYYSSWKGITACPVAFVDGGVKKRIRHVLRYKKPSLWIASAALILCIGIVFFLMTDPFPYSKRTWFVKDSVSRIIVTSYMCDPVKTVKIADTQVDDIIDYLQSIKVRCVGASNGNTGSDYLFRFSLMYEDNVLFRIIDRRRIEVNGLLYETYRPIDEYISNCFSEAASNSNGTENDIEQSETQEKTAWASLIIGRPNIAEKVTLSVPSEHSMLFPVSGSNKVIKGYMEGVHESYDISVTESADIIAPFEGIVRIACYYENTGGYIVIEHGGGILTDYDGVQMLKVKEGDRAKKGDVIGTAGPSEKTKFNCICFRVIKERRYVDPEKYLEQ